MYLIFFKYKIRINAFKEIDVFKTGLASVQSEGLLSCQPVVGGGGGAQGEVTGAHAASRKQSGCVVWFPSSGSEHTVTAWCGG